MSRIIVSQRSQSLAWYGRTLFDMVDTIVGCLRIGFELQINYTLYNDFEAFENSNLKL